MRPTTRTPGHMGDECDGVGWRVGRAGGVRGQGAFAGYVAHELRTPLATQRALLELALADPDADVGCWREIGEDVLDCCLQQERLLEACLMLARSERRPERCEPVNLGVVAAEALRAHDLTGLDLLVTLKPAWVSGDPGLLERLVANLVSNAIGHNVVGGWIEVGSRTESGRAHISVTNSGPRVPGRRAPASLQAFRATQLNLDRDARRCRPRPRHRSGSRGRPLRSRDAANSSRRRPQDRRRLPRKPGRLGCAQRVRRSTRSKKTSSDGSPRALPGRHGRPTPEPQGASRDRNQR